jgi:hypothetical protein
MICIAGSTQQSQISGRRQKVTFLSMQSIDSFLTLASPSRCPRQVNCVHVWAHRNYG